MSRHFFTSSIKKKEKQRSAPHFSLLTSEQRRDYVFYVEPTAAKDINIHTKIG